MRRIRCERASISARAGRGLRAARPRAIAIVVGCSLALFAGCANIPSGTPADAPERDGFFGWHVQAPFDTSEVKTVYVFFKSQRFRRDLQLMLTEAVTKEINMRTPFRVVGDPTRADSHLTGIITVDDKNLIVEAPTNLPRQLNATMTVWINWKSNPPSEAEKNQQPTQITEALNFVPEVGQTTLTSFEQVTENIAKQIVDMMEQPWFNQSDLR